MIDLKNLLDVFYPESQVTQVGKTILKTEFFSKLCHKVGGNSKILSKKVEFFKLPKSSLLF